MLVAVHGQADQWRLRQGDQHRDVLDEFGGEPVTAALRAYREAFDALARASAEHDRLRHVARERAREIDSLQARLEQIEALDPQPGEDVALRAEDERLAHADTPPAGGGAGARLPRRRRRVCVGRRRAGGRRAVRRAGRARLRRPTTTPPSASWRAASPSWPTSPPTWRPTCRPTSTTSSVDPARLAEVQQRRADLAGLTRSTATPSTTSSTGARTRPRRSTDLLGADDRVHALGRRDRPAAARAGRPSPPR